jgi:GTP-binding protein EngB required for normal cell division
VRIAGIAQALSMPRVAGEARLLLDRVGAGRFHVACVGQFKRGKSTLLNALVGEEVLPTGVVPVTAIPTILRFAPKRSALVRMADGSTLDVEPSGIAAYVAESENPDNVKQVEMVELLLPSTLLKGGMCLVDTPGLGSVFRVATGATRAFLPNMDAALVVLGADPPISAEEVALVESVAQQVEDILVVLTKADRATDLDRAEASAFTRRILAEHLGRDPGPVLEVSARERLENGPTRDWPALVSALGDLSGRAKGRIVEAARRRGVRRMAGTLARRIAQEREALLLPVEQSERRLTALSASLQDIDERLRHLSWLFNAEQGRVRLLLHQRRQDFLGAVRPVAFQRLDAEAARLGSLRGPVFRWRVAEFVRGTAQELVEPWLKTEEEEAEALYLRIAGRFVGIANAFLDELEASGEMGLERLPEPLATEQALRAERAYRFNRFESRFVSALPTQWLADSLLPGAWARRGIRREARAFLDWLMEANSTRVQNDLLERVLQSRRRLERDMRTILEEAGRWAEAMIRRIRETQASGAEAVERAVEGLDRLREELEELTESVDRP